jgi:hypothetical protein
MKDPWLFLIAALSGHCVATPTSWSARRVHRLDSSIAVAQAQAAARRQALQPDRRR